MEIGNIYRDESLYRNPEMQYIRDCLRDGLFEEVKK